MLQNVAQEEAAAQSFYQTYFCDILQHIFSVVTDTSHTAGEFTEMWRHPEVPDLRNTRKWTLASGLCLCVPQA